MGYEKEQISRLATIMVSLGFDVWLAKKGTHGFYTDSAGTRIVDFSFSRPNMRALFGSYKGTREHGEGWLIIEGLDDLTVSKLNKYLYMPAPSWTGNKNPIYTTKLQHLKEYGKSSKYQQILK